MTHTVKVLTPAEAAVRRPALVELLVDAVASGASVNFVQPMTAAKAEAWWDRALAGHASGDRLILVAETEAGRLDGTVQLVPAPQENQAHRADLAKMLVHTRARRQGLGALLLGAAEAEARRIGRTLLTLDTETGSNGERLYLRHDWTRFGTVPGYAMPADGTSRSECSFFYKEL